jgi:hypothetical protein
VAAASKALVLDESADGQLGRNMTISGTLVVDGTVGAGGLFTADAGIDMLYGSLKMNGNDLFLDADHNSKFLADDDNDILQLWLGGNEKYRWDGDAFGPSTAGANDLGGELGVSSGTAANPWGNLNLAGHMSMKAISTPSNPAENDSMKLYQDASSGNLMVILKKGTVSKPFTLQAFA